MLATAGVIVMWVGLALMLVGALLFVIAAFREGILWGLAVLFLPIVSIIFLIVHWHRAKDPFLMQVSGFIFVLIAVSTLAAKLPPPW